MMVSKLRVAKRERRRLRRKAKRRAMWKQYHVRRKPKVRVRGGARYAQRRSSSSLSTARTARWSHRLRERVKTVAAASVGAAFGAVGSWLSRVRSRSE